MRTYYIYKVTDVTNNKVYVGQSCQPNKRRWQHLSNRKEDDCLFHRALVAHGKENFIWEIVDKADSLKEASELEKKYIRKFNSFKPNGYNMTKGGDGGCMWNARPVVRFTLDGEYVERYDSAGEAIKDGFHDSDVLRCCKQLSCQCKGYAFMFEDDYLERGFLRKTKKEPTQMRPVIQCDMNGNLIARYKSAKEAAEKTGILRSRISSAANGFSKSAGGYIFVFEEDFPIKDLSKHEKRVKGVKIAQIDPKTNKVIATYDRTTDAARALGVNYKSIHKALSDEWRTAFGFKWKRL